MSSLFVAKQFSDTTEYKSRRTGHRYNMSRNAHGYSVNSNDTNLLFLTKSKAQALMLIELADANTG